MGPKRATGHPDREVASIAARQHGVVLLAQLVAVGVTQRAVARRVQSGRLHRIHRGVYAVGHRRLSKEGSWLAAVLACGEGAVLSHRSAAGLWNLLPASPGIIDVTVPGAGGRRKRRGIRVHRSRTLLPSHCTLHNAIPVTKPARTLEDLRRVTTPDEFRAAVRQAEVLGLPLGAHAVDADLTRSELEHRFLRLCRRHRIPAPEVNVRIGPFLVDFLWRDERLIAETDGYRFHRGREAFEADRARDVELKLLGFTVVRFTHRQVMDEPSQVAQTLRMLLA
jgi:very-short-patch-repair endonuclease